MSQTLIKPAQVSQWATYASKSALVAAINSNSVSVSQARTLYHTTTDDEGGASYRRVLASSLDQYITGLNGTQTSLVKTQWANAGVTIADPDTNYVWLLAETSPSFAMVGAFGAPLEITGLFPTYVDTVIASGDCAEQLSALSTYLWYVYRGGVIRYGRRNYYIGVGNTRAGSNSIFISNVRAATTANITPSGTQTIDGVALSAGDRVLVKNQTDTTQNGVYVVAAGSWSRSTDADVWNELYKGYTFVTSGTTLAGTTWLCTVGSSGTVGSTAITWAQDTNTYVTVLEQAVGLRGPVEQGRDPAYNSVEFGKVDSVAAYWAIPGLCLADAARIAYNDNFTADTVTFKRANFKTHSTLTDALTSQSAFVGTALIKQGGGATRNVSIRNINFYGFDYGAVFDKAHGCRIFDIYGDCNTLIKLTDSGETCWLQRIKRKPVLANNDDTSVREAAIAGIYQYDMGGGVIAVGVALQGNAASPLTNLLTTPTSALRTGERSATRKTVLENGYSRVAINVIGIPYSSGTGPVRAATTANIALSGTQTIDGVAVVAGDRVLVKNQTDTTKNGVYVVAAGSWSRSTDADAWNEISGAYYTVTNGTTNSNTTWVCTSSIAGTLGTSPITWALTSSATLGATIGSTDAQIPVQYRTDAYTNVVFTNQLWSAWSAWSPSAKSKISWSPGSGASVTGISSASSATGYQGKLQLTLGLPHPFLVGHIGLFDWGKYASIRGMRQVLATPSTTTVVIDVNVCIAATTANITLSGTQTIDGVAVVAGDRVLVKNQTDATQNGVYVVAAGAWSRSPDADVWDELVGMFQLVTSGTTNANTMWASSATLGGTLGTTPITWTAATPVSLSTSEFSAMPMVRRHLTPDTDIVGLAGLYSNTDVTKTEFQNDTRGYGVIITGSDGCMVDSATKGNAGVFCDSGPSSILGSNEGGSVGELDLSDPDTSGFVLTQPRTVFTLQSKSNGTALTIAPTAAATSMFGYGCELVDNGTASLDLRTGSVQLMQTSVRGPGRIKLSNIQYLDVIGGELRPTGLTNTSLLYPNAGSDIRRTHWRYIETDTMYEVHSNLKFQTWDTGGTVVSDVMTLNSTGVTFSVPVDLGASTPIPNHTPLSSAGSWISPLPPGAVFTTGTAVNAVDTLYLVPVYVERATTLSQLGIRVTATGAGSSCKVGIWASGSSTNGTSIPIGTCLRQGAAAIDTATATGAISANLNNYAIAAGWYWVGFVFTGTLPSVQMVDSSGSLYRYIGVNNANVALPTSPTATFSGVSIANPYSTDLSTVTFTSSSSFTSLTTPRVPWFAWSRLG